jgi:hypothetical protein
MNSVGMTDSKPTGCGQQTGNGDTWWLPVSIIFGQERSTYHFPMSHET